MSKKRPRPASATYHHPQKKTHSALQLQILQVLEQTSKPVTALEVAQKVGLRTRKEVNPDLYAMEKQGVIKMNESRQPPLWEITHRAPLTNQSAIPSTLSIDHPPETTLQVGSSSPVLDLNTHSLTSTVNKMNMNPVSALTEHCQANKTNLTFIDVREYGPPHMKHFVIAAQIGAVRYSEVDDTCKKEAKRKAADIALQVIHRQRAHKKVEPTNTANDTIFSDKIAKLSHTEFARVQSSIHHPQPGRNVIAAFVMEEAASGEMKVVALGSGTRCVSGDQMSLEGAVVNDSHAEVIARRSLIRFFYTQLFDYYQGSSGGTVDTIFEASEVKTEMGHEQPWQTLRLKPNIQLHLYITTAPCGDAALFSTGDDNQNMDSPSAGGLIQTSPSEDEHIPTMQGKKQGLLRTKMENGEGTIPIESDAPPLTWDGILAGQRLRTMSCSDKIGRWNVLGLQGSLLSLFMSPVYMSSLTLGSLHHHGHLCRAVCCRFDDINDTLPPQFTVNHPSLREVKGYDIRRRTEKTHNFSVNWALGDERGEIVDGGSGRRVPTPGSHATSTVPARIAKKSLFANFMRLARLCKRCELLSRDTYRDAKEIAIDFQKAKHIFYRHCQSKGYGSWVRKPDEEEHFGGDAFL